MIFAILNRYLSTIVQFGVLSFLAKSLSQEHYGLYVLCLSVTYSFYYILGFGTSERAVIEISRDLAIKEKNRIGSYIASVFIVVSISLVIVFFGILMVAFFSDYTYQSSALIFVTVFLFANGITFNASQIILSLGHSSLGSFFFYPAVNFTIALYLAIASFFWVKPNFDQIAILAGLASLSVAFIAVTVCLIYARGFKLKPSISVCINFIRSGFSLGIIRILHVSSFWVPTMVAGLMLSNVAAGIIGTAGRLAIAVAAVIAALRFVLRPKLIEAIALEKIAELRILADQVAFLTLFTGFVAIIINLFWGEYLISIFFGEKFLAVVPLLNILLIGVCAEAVFGPVDEILKATEGYSQVTLIYVFSVFIFSICSFMVAPKGLELMAWLQVIYVLFIFSAMNFCVFQRYGFFIYPSWRGIKGLIMRRIN